MDVMEKLVELLFKCGIIGSYSDIERIANWLIKDGVTVQEWISVKDRLPEKPGKYLVSGAWRGEPAKTWICEFVVIANVGGWANPARKPVVTHWMPLPEPPKGE